MRGVGRGRSKCYAESLAGGRGDGSAGSSWFWWNCQELLIQTFSQNVKINARFWELTLRGLLCKWTTMSLLGSMKLPSNFSADTLGTCVIFEEDVEEHGGVEWLQIKDNDSSNRPNMICSFLHENEDEEVVAQAPDKPLELKEQEIQMKDNSDLSYEQGKPLHLEIEDSGPLIEIPSFDTEGFDFMETQDADLEATPR
ncbi:general transcription factor 3C polypeptide 6 isoform X6 [Loxodonta africana]|uniref:general transcription factor 3C polypeptide 6 isoform X3 n=1 Tax=Elephas maximus indicus TaxID=99487 RepID=UPI002117009B|nr:general transcription factor 3C polypeptide 6 isoform X3 [Elephas maximus indicus]